MIVLVDFAAVPTGQGELQDILELSINWGAGSVKVTRHGEAPVLGFRQGACPRLARRFCCRQCGDGWRGDGRGEAQEGMMTG